MAFRLSFQVPQSFFKVLYLRGALLVSCPKAVFDGVPEAKGQTLAEVNGFELDGLLFVVGRMIN